MIPDRYPFTYGYDFFRSHGAAFGVPGMLSRGEASQAITRYVAQTGQHREDVVVALADAYLAKYDIVATQEQKDAAMAKARTEYWKSLGLDSPNGQRA